MSAREALAHIPQQRASLFGELDALKNVFAEYASLRGDR